MVLRQADIQRGRGVFRLDDSRSAISRRGTSTGRYRPKAAISRRREIVAIIGGRHAHLDMAVTRAYG